jgi:uroporphyrin-III C-methyltransferase/precorrin-2 dehydrogenase/sirohydrochlorin ferrochelatase
VDDSEACTAQFGGIVRRGEVAVAISTGGQAPALAGLVREAVDLVLPAEEELASWLETARALRDQHRAEAVPHERRRQLLLEALVGRELRM